ncbi:GlxA family transcriptional regulator [Acuticoccus sp. I52.16.1]|uniref:GlxA family transcriptional regulator n=1 Tax=Acuticoccus sp. I52.16.1 TaxID=2928472 RepID=UPI001FD1CA1B|nr:GlxA family transcriptional regulator [Acuticoccus sp. I52.16.1]UOM37244.1 GlxA family transcriptional regulator [Acuticoccus sp. I52.16.1]
MIGIFIFPDFQLLDATGPAAVFEIARRLVPTAPQVRMLAVEAGPVRASCGVEVMAADMTKARGLSTLITAGGLGVEQAMDCRRTQAFFRTMVRQKRQVASVCTGAYILAQSGLLDGRKATTHWQQTAEFVARFPKVRLEPDRIFHREGNVWTSAGVTAGIDMALAMVADSHGEEIAMATARQLVLYHRRSGGQTQFSSLLELKSPNGRFGALLSWIRENLHRPLTVEMLADRAGLSARHFARIFASETGTTPAKAIERLRLEVARERIESSGDLIETIAESTGFRDPERMRRAFLRAYGQPPQGMRRAARQAKTVGG